MAKRAAFLDRDGTLIRDPGYTRDADSVELLPGVADALRRLAEAGYTLVIVTNQSAVSRGFATAGEVEAVNQRVIDRLGDEGVTIAGVYYCPHHPDDGCECRKPRPGMLLRAAADHGIDLSDSIMIGDKLSDVEAGRAAGCRESILIESMYHRASWAKADLAAAAASVLDG